VHPIATTCLLCGHSYLLRYEVGRRMVPASWIPPDALADQPSYEAVLIAGLRDVVRAEDSVVIVGGGLGVTAVVAALLAGPLGSVQCFEGSKHRASLVQQTAARNGVTNLRVRHAVVAKSIGVYRSRGDVGRLLPAAQLPPCDVLELDCEGAEVESLQELTVRPRVILVETHGVYGAPTRLVTSVREKRGYAILDRGVAVPAAGDFCVNNDIRVLLGSCC
jgi:hypothetical protein